MPSKRTPKWYDAQGQGGSRRAVLQQSNPGRTLISLVLLLGLVLLLLQQLSDTDKVAEIGEAIGLFEKKQASDDEASSRSESSPLAVDVPSEAIRIYRSLLMRSDDNLSDREQSIWTYYLSRLSPEQHVLLVRFWLAPKSTLDSDEIEPLLESAEQTFQGWVDRIAENHSARVPSSDQTQDSTDLDLVALEKVLASIAQWRETQFADRDSHSAFRRALDKTLLERFLDNQNWMSKEQLVALRTWARIRELRSAVDSGFLDPLQVPALELSQLMGADNDNYRGVPLRFRGTIAAADERTGRLQSVEWNGVVYRVWWMKPTEASSQPIAVYVPVELEPSKYEKDQKSELEILGFFAKRKAYASSRGPDIAPVLFAASVTNTVGPQRRKLGPYSAWLAEHRQTATWRPPVDFKTPLTLIQSSIKSNTMLSNIAENNLGDKELTNALALLLVAKKHEPEMQTLASAGRDWDTTESLVLRKMNGWVNHIKVLNLKSLRDAGVDVELLEVLARESLETIYELSLQVRGEGTDHANKLFTTEIPDAWASSIRGDTLSLKQPFEVIGVQPKGEIGKSSWLVSSRVAWKLQSEDQSLLAELNPSVTDVDRFLLEQGWDLANRDIIQRLQSPAQPLSRQEEVGLFSLMRIARETRDSLASDANFKATSVSQIVKSSLGADSKSKQRPSLLWTECNVRVVRVTRIPIDLPVQQAVLGKDHYFQLDCFAEIGNVTFEIPTDTQPIVYAGEYPITCVAIELPSWLAAYQGAEVEPSDAGNGLKDTNSLEPINADVFFPRVRGKLSGWFYRFWSYRTQEMTDRLGVKHRQVTPLIVISDLQISLGDDSAPSERLISTLAWLFGLATVGSVWWVVRSYGKSKTKNPKKPIRFSVRGGNEQN
ncbi:hypothetical protein SH449x_000659 [Pirellulaceae bacterium SH449]